MPKPRFTGVAYSAITMMIALSHMSCEKKGDKSDSSGSGNEEQSKTDTVQVGEVALSDNALAIAYPEGLNITVFPTEKVNPAVVQTVAIDTASLRLTQAGQPGGANGGSSGNDDGGCDLNHPNFKRWAIDKDGNIVGTGEIKGEGIDPRDPCTPATPNDQVAQNNVMLSATGDSSDFKPETFSAEQKLKDEATLLAGTAETCFPQSIGKRFGFMPHTVDRCYQFDYGIMKGTSCESKPKEENEACLVSYGKGLVFAETVALEANLDIMKGILCEARKSGKTGDNFKVGTSLDLTAEFQKAKGEHLLPTSATITRLDDKDGRPVFKSVIKFKSGPSEQILNLAHSPSTEGNRNYDGVIWIESSELDRKLTSLKSMRYKRTTNDSGTRLKLNMVSAQVDPSLPFFTSVGDIDLTSTAKFSGDKTSQNYGNWSDNEATNRGLMSAVVSIAFDVDLATSAGYVSYFQNPSGNYNESARGFTYEISYNNDTGYLEGCGIAGAAFRTDGSGRDPVSIRTSFHENLPLSIRGYYTPQMCHENGKPEMPFDNVGSKIWKQCFRQSDSGKYVLDTSQTASDKGYDWLEFTEASITAPDTSGIDTPGVVTQ